MLQSQEHLVPIKGYTWIVCHPNLLGGSPAIKGTRLSVSHILACLAEKMTPQEIAEDYPGFPIESVPDILRFAAEQVEKVKADALAA